jgi:cell division septal protein FtsQ
MHYHVSARIYTDRQKQCRPTKEKDKPSPMKTEQAWMAYILLLLLLLMVMMMIVVVVVVVVVVVAEVVTRKDS